MLHALQDEPDAKALTVSTGTVEFHGVGFEYIPGTPVLRNLNFKAEGGKTLALVGETGSGKSTILRLIFRFYNPLSKGATHPRTVPRRPGGGGFHCHVDVSSTSRGRFPYPSG